MLSIWIGRAGAGKSRRVLETMARQRSQRPQVLLVPEHISHEAEVDLCRALGPTASRDAEVLSFQSLGSRVLARTICSLLSHTVLSSSGASSSARNSSSVSTGTPSSCALRSLDPALAPATT